jgi:glycerol-3-phosphate acyltransferase PlsY
LIYGKEIFVIAAAYALGCISTGYYLTRLRTGKDIRQTGSGSTGARNVSRILGKRWFAFTLAVDFLKGAAAAGLALYLGVEGWIVAACVLAAVGGHIWPAQLGFRGGKGVSVMLGGLAVLDYHLLLVMGMVFGVLYLLTHRYIVSGMIAIVTLPITAVFLDSGPKSMSTLIVLTVMLLFAHRGNIHGVIQEGRARAGAIFGSEK